MDDVTRGLLENEIEAMFEDLSNLETGSEEKKSAVGDLEKLYKLKIEEYKNNWDYDEKYERRVMENEQHQRDNELKEKQITGEAETRERELVLKENQLKEQKLDRWVNLGIQVGLTCVSIFAYDRWFRRGLKFEETGTVTSPMTKNLLSKMLPKR